MFFTKKVTAPLNANGGTEYYTGQQYIKFNVLYFLEKLTTWEFSDQHFNIFIHLAT